MNLVRVGNCRRNCRNYQIYLSWLREKGGDRSIFNSPLVNSPIRKESGAKGQQGLRFPSRVQWERIFAPIKKGNYDRGRIKRAREKEMRTNLGGNCSSPFERYNTTFFVRSSTWHGNCRREKKLLLSLIFDRINESRNANKDRLSLQSTECRKKKKKEEKSLLIIETGFKRLKDIVAIAKNDHATQFSHSRSTTFPPE